MGRNILVMGGTGAMGIHLVKILENLQDNVYVTSRSKRISTKNVHYIQGDAHEITFIKKVLSQRRYNAIIDFMTYSTAEFKERYTEYLDATDQYFLLSTARVYAQSDIIKENSPRLLDVVNDSEYLKTDEYALCKARQEDILKNSGKKNWTIIRPYMTYSENRLQLGIFDKDTFVYRAIHGRPIVVSNDIISHTTTLTYGYDVSHCITKLIGNPKAYGETFHITTDKTIPWMDVLNIYMKAIEEKTGKEQKVVITPRSNQLDYPVQCYQVLYDRMYDRKFDNSKIIEAIGDYTFMDPYIGIKKCIDSFLEKPYFSLPSGKIEGTNDHYSHSFTPLNEFVGLKNKISYLLYRISPNICNKIRKILK